MESISNVTSSGFASFFDPLASVLCRCGAGVAKAAWEDTGGAGEALKQGKNAKS